MSFLRAPAVENMEAELRDVVQERRAAPPGKRLLTLIEDLVEPADGDTANSRNRNESTDKHHLTPNSVFKRPAIPGTSRAEQDTK